ncbi:hypothetical protein N7468_004592 [Penicillium chermesinum]|uniref:Pex19-domain-containing protein n=1 Tax=Penicillium chermesinum TaxID=63820 RepID=A0A9W9P8R0_9EURO|nr:uncharacterized protein N7468_004592 [Penicillium chermesinum]KAJ5239973.1 hypothetical protein N7468_004592 [Penicillium chermesinum]
MSSPGPDHQALSPAVLPAKAEQDAANTQPANSAPPQEPVQPAQPRPTVHDEDSDSDLDELDDVLDDFSKPKPAPAAPAAPASTEPALGPADFNEDDFLKQLEADMANLMGNAAGGAPSGRNAADLASMEQGADAFAKQLEESGIPPGDFLKQLLADVMNEESSVKGSSAPAGTGSAAASAAAAAASSVAGHGAEQASDFNDAIQRTMERMKASGDKATEAASTDDGDDMIAQLLKAVEAGASGAGDDGDLSKMFMGMMEQLSNKEMLYEPMKELDGKFGPWIAKNKAEGTVPVEDMERYESQARIVGQIVKKFEEPGYSDEDSKCREYVWERMQELRAAHREELISNPLMGDLGGAGAGAEGVPDCPQQ